VETLYIKVMSYFMLSLHLIQNFIIAPLCGLQQIIICAQMRNSKNEYGESCTPKQRG